MTLRRSLLAVLACSALAFACSEVEHAGSADEGLFLDLGYEQALEKAKADGRIVLLDFTAGWCPPCRAMEKSTWPDARVQEWIAREAVALQIDVDSDKQRAAALSIASIPTIVFLDGDGTELGRFTGFRDPDAFLEEAQRHAR